jgi:hypothetical protein
LREITEPNDGKFIIKRYPRGLKHISDSDVGISVVFLNENMNLYFPLEKMRGFGSGSKFFKKAGSGSGSAYNECRSETHARQIKE